MSKSKEIKKQVVTELVDSFNNNKFSTIVFEYTSLSANEMNNLRSTLHTVNTSTKILKNTLIKILFEKLGVKIENKPIGQNAILIPGDDFPSAVKVLSDFFDSIEKTDEVEETKTPYKFGVIDGNILSTEDVISLASLPSKEVLLSKLVFALNSPTQGFTQTLQEIPAMFIRTLSKISENKS